MRRPSDRGDIVISIPARVIEADKLAGFLRNGLNTNELSDLCDTLDLAVSGPKADKTGITTEAVVHALRWSNKTNGFSLSLVGKN